MIKMTITHFALSLSMSNNQKGNDVLSTIIGYLFKCTLKGKKEDLYFTVFHRQRPSSTQRALWLHAIKRTDH